METIQDALVPLEVVEGHSCGGRDGDAATHQLHVDTEGGAPRLNSETHGIVVGCNDEEAQPVNVDQRSWRRVWMMGAGGDPIQTP